MSGNIRTAGYGVWEVRLDSGRDPVTGRRRQLSRRVHGSKRAAQKVLNALATEIDVGRFVGTSTTFAELCTQWLTLAENDLSPTTLRRYKNLLSKRILPALGDRPLKNIRTIDLDQLYLGLSNRVGLAPATVRQIHAVIRRAFRQAILWGWINTNPATNATPPRLAKPDLSPPDIEQVAELIDKATERDPELGHFFHIAASTGARRGEVCALRWSNLDTQVRTLTIERSIIEILGGLSEKDTKTHANRRIKLDPVTLEVFEAQRAIMTERAACVGMVLADDAYVFSREPNGLIPLTPGYVTKQFALIKDDLGYHSMRLHDLRHFAATRLMAAGIPIRQVSGRLGHANPSTTLSVYTHFLEARDQESADVMGQSLPKSKSTAKAKSAETTTA
ncbi:MAG TPA: site-specific integrase [Acidimicrobiales bacterium]|nr:site-specific integrase [Acidimicrobiales bacterium]